MKLKGFHKIDYRMYEHKLSPLARLVFSIMEDMQGGGNKCFFRQKEMAKMLGCERKFIMKAIKELIDGKFIEKLSTKKGWSNDYKVVFYLPRGVSLIGTTVVPDRDRGVSLIGTTTTYPIQPKKYIIPKGSDDDDFFDFLGEPKGPEGKRARAYCKNICTEAGLDPEEEWKRSWKNWFKLARAREDLSAEEDEKVNELIASVKQGYRVFDISAVICKRICRI